MYWFEARLALHGDFTFSFPCGLPPAKTPKAPQCRTNKEVAQKHTGTFLPALNKVLHHNEARFKALLRSFVYQLKQAMRAGRRVHTVAAICEHGKHRSVAVMTMLDMMLRMLGATTTVEHLSKPRWGKRNCGWRDCEICDIHKHTEMRGALALAATPWLQQLLQ